jgi:ribosomal-protein-alanine N-acetyltransferase
VLSAVTEWHLGLFWRRATAPDTIPGVTPVDRQPQPGPRLRKMSANDLPAVLAVERAAYESGWPATAFERELAHNEMARYVVLERFAEDGSAAIAGFGGIWLMVDQAHIVTVAVAPVYRRLGFGRLLVHGLINLAIDSAMSSGTLEVRVSNAPARALYSAYGFYEVGLRKRYYADNHEDAVIMTTEEFASDAYRRRLAGLETALTRLHPGVLARCVANEPADA